MELTSSSSSGQGESGDLTPSDALATGPMEAEAARYLRKHRIPQLLENLTAALVFNRPEDPRAFMREHIEQLRKAKLDPTHSPPIFIDESNVKSVFGMLDLAGNGNVTHQQYLQAMETLGVSNFARNPPGSEIDKISRQTFIREANVALKDAASTYLDN